MKIVVLDGYTLNPGDLSYETLRTLGEVTIYDRTDPASVVSRIGDAPIVLTNKTVIDEGVLTQCNQIKYIGVLATGYNVVDIEAARKRGILVTNVPTYGTKAVSQYTMALLLELCHHIGDHSRSVKAGQWTDCKDFCYWQTPLVELESKTLGIIGYGKIGQATAQLAKAFGMNVLVYNKRPMDPKELGEQIQQVSLEKLLRQSDVISLHCPLNADTKGLINQLSIEQMKDGVLIINTARGDLIVEKDLKNALMCGKVAGAAVDVVSTEPIQKDNPLLDAPNIIITPHIAWASTEARTRLLKTVVDNLESYLKGKPINCVQ